MKRYAFLLLCILMCVPAIALLLPGLESIGLSTLKHQAQGHFLRNWRFDISDLFKSMQQHLPDDAVVLTFRQSGFGFYGHRHFIDHNDPRLMDLYRMKDPQQALQAMRQLGITHLLLPPYAPPTCYNTTIQTLLRDPDTCPLLLANRGDRLFAIRPRPAVPVIAERLPVSALDFAQPPTRSLQVTDLLTDAPALTFETMAFWTPNHHGQFTPGTATTPWHLHNDSRVRYQMHTGPGDLRRSPLSYPGGDAFTLMPNRHHRLTVQARGRGRLSILLFEYGDPNPEDPRELEKWHLVYDGLLRDTFESLGGQALTGPKAKAYRIVLILNGAGTLEVRDVELQKLIGSPLLRTD